MYPPPGACSKFSGTGDASMSARKLLGSLWRMTKDGANEESSSTTSSSSNSTLNYGRTADCDLFSRMEGSFMENTFILEKGSKNSIMVSGLAKNVGNRKGRSKYVLEAAPQEAQPGEIGTKIRINKLKSDCRLLKLKLNEERISREKKIQKIVQESFDRVRVEIETERKKRKKIEKLNTDLTNDLLRVAVKLRSLEQDFRDEKNGRQAIEEDYKELVEKSAMETRMIEEFKMESIRIQEEMEEERRMLQLAEVWREERVQMKLSDAKLTLLNKYEEMNKCLGELENYIASKKSELPWAELKKAERIREAAKLISIDGIEFSYTKPRVNDLKSIVQEIEEYETSLGC